MHTPEATHERSSSAPEGSDEIYDEGQFPATPAGLQRAIAWVARRTGADLGTLWVIEGVGTYGARLARAATDAGSAVVEAARMNARANRGMGKSDPLDARRIASAVLPLEDAQLRRPRSDDGVRAALRVLIAPSDRISTERTAAIIAVIALLSVVDLGVDARGALNASQITEIAVWRTHDDELAVGIARARALCLAKRVRAGDRSYQSSLVSLTEEIQQTTRTRPPHQPRLPQPGPLPTQITARSQRLPAPRPLSFVTSR